MATAKPNTSIANLLPDVNRSDVNKTLFSNTFDKFLTKDDTYRVAGYVGQGNPAALVNRQIQELTPHGQAFQLSPVVCTTVGTKQYTLTDKNFLSQLSLLGVDVTNVDRWASTSSFNWVPPINIDMFVNYADYFWKPDATSTSSPQHFTIENRCNKATSRLNSFKAVVNSVGAIIAVSSLDFADNAFVVSGKHDDLFVNGFAFNTTNSPNVNFNNKRWTVVSSTYASDVDETTVVVSQSMAIRTQLASIVDSVTPPVAAYDYQLWFKYSTGTTPLSQLYTWTGTQWSMTSQNIQCSISLQEQLAVYQTEMTCACDGDTGGFDMALWDDNQQTSMLWNEALLQNISFNTEAEWIGHNGTQANNDLWFDLTSDQLKQWSTSSNVWGIVQDKFSTLLVETTGKAAWDASSGCTPQVTNQWSNQNKWVHKSELTSFVGAKRAQVPILEYSSQAELNAWTKVTRSWKYRIDGVSSYESSTNTPHRFELEPVKSYVADMHNGVWTIYLGSAKNSACRDINYTDTFIPGYKFRIVDSTGASTLFTVATTEYREISSTDPQDLTVGTFCTVITLEESEFPCPVVAGAEYEKIAATSNIPYTRIEPVTTSVGDPWRGYHVHWVLDKTNVTSVPCAPQPQSVYVAEDNSSTTEMLTTSDGTSYVTGTYQEFTVVGSSVSQINLDRRFQYDPSRPSAYAIVAENGIRVYVNGIRQYGTYTEVAYSGAGVPDYTVVNGVGLANSVTQTTFGYIYAIRFNTTLSNGDVVRIEVAPASLLDVGMTSVPVRTIDDDTLFQQAVIAGTQPVYTNLSTFYKNEQVKSQINQYPLFNLYDIETDNVEKISSVFSFTEDAAQSVNSSTQRRIVVDSTGKEFSFDQSLLDEDNGRIYAYRLITGDESEFWYNPKTQTLHQWQTDCWSTSIVVAVSTGRRIVTPSTSKSSVGIDGDIWIDAANDCCYKYTSSTGTWDQIQSVVQIADPTLTTIWRCGQNGTQYTPKYVDRNGTNVERLSAGGDWEVLEQWRYNPSHQNHKTVLYSQLITHMASILAGQQTVPGLTDGGLFTLTQDSYDYGVGGTIKEHNDSFDTLISAINSNSITPIGTIEFACEQYQATFPVIREALISSIGQTLLDNPSMKVSDITDTLTSLCMSKLSNDEFLSLVYGDSLSVNPSTGLGVSNVISTAPILSLTPSIKPYYVRSGSSVIMTHHDGHKSYNTVSAIEIDQIARTVVNKANKISAGSGVISTVAPDATSTAQFWYHCNGGTCLLYTKSTTNQWQLIDIIGIVGDVMLNFESSLYRALPESTKLAFDYNQLFETAEYAAASSAKLYSRFLQYTSAKGITAPMVNTGYTTTDPFTWNYKFSTITTPPRDNITIGAKACWQALYNSWFNTAYPHLEPWALQGYTTPPDWWQNVYSDSTGQRTWLYDETTDTGMWHNVMHGIVPSGYQYPDGTMSTGNPVADGVSMPAYNYVPVNIANVSIGSYAPDQLLPPYWDYTNSIEAHPLVRSLFATYSINIIAPHSDYLFGDQGPAEWQWMQSCERVYDNLAVAFMLQPMKFMHDAFGLSLADVKYLQYDLISKRVYSHTNGLFHGDIYNTNDQFKARGINQWYVNYGRFYGFDTNAQFVTRWKDWKSVQAYQCDGIVDTETLQIFNNNFDVTDQDYNILLANNGVVNELWLDTFGVSVLNVPPAIKQYNNQAKWKFSVQSSAAITRTLKYFGPQVWPFYINEDGSMTCFRYVLSNVSSASNTFELLGDQTPFFITDVTFDVSGSSTNNGTYTVVESLYDSTTNVTRVQVQENIASSVPDGIVDISSFSHNWRTGDMIVVMADTILPYPFIDQTPYYVNRVDSRTVRLAQTEMLAVTNVTLDAKQSKQLSNVTLGKIKSTFQAMNGSGNNDDVWYHFELNTNDIRTIQSPVVIYSMQNLINFIDGFKAAEEANGVVYSTNADFVEFDTDTGRPVSWQTEVERFINWAYGLHRTRLQTKNKFQFVVSNIDQNTFKFVGGVPAWTVGTAVAVSTTGVLPSPLFADTRYYVVQSVDDPSIFQLSIAPNTAKNENIVDVTSIGSGTLTIAEFNTGSTTVYPSFEINPHRNHVQIDTSVGILSNVFSGPYADIRVSQQVYDQYGRTLTPDKIAVYRNGDVSRVTIKSQLYNDQLIKTFVDDPYNYLHIGGGHFFIEGYQHIILLNDYTTDNDLVYDQFLGLWTRRFDLDFWKRSTRQLRPELGGYFLSDNRLIRNFEGSVTDMRQYYDTYQLKEGTPVAARSRAILGYTPNDGSMSYLDLMNVNDKSQFLFYKGMIQTKGSVNSILSYVNSKKFVDAKVDEFWAYKVGEFGDSRSKVYPQIKLLATDSIKSDVRLKFMKSTDVDYTARYDSDRGFEIVSFTNTDRWVNFPQQRDLLGSPLFLKASITQMHAIHFTHSVTDGMDIQPAYGQAEIDLWIHVQHNTDGTTNPTTRRWIGGVWQVVSNDEIVVVNNNVYLRVPINDGLRVIRRRITPNAPSNLLKYSSESMNEVDFANGFARVNSEIVKFSALTVPIISIAQQSGSMYTIVELSKTTANVFQPGDTIKIVRGSNVVFTTVLSADYSEVTGNMNVIVNDYITPSADGHCTVIGAAGTMVMFGVSTPHDTNSPAQIYDTQTRAKITDIPIWHPACGYHSTIAYHNIDVVNNQDPALYGVQTPSSTQSSPQAWQAPEKDTVWLDTYNLGYKPYYDDILVPDVEDRINTWGQLAPWASVDVYRWVETTIHPSLWDSVVTTQSKNASIATNDKVTGTPRTVLFNRSRIADTATVSVGASGVVQLQTHNNTYGNGTIVMISGTDVPTSVSSSTHYQVSNYDEQTSTFVITDTSDVVLTDLPDDITVTLMPTFSDNWQQWKRAHKRVYAAMLGLFSTAQDTVVNPTVVMSTSGGWTDGDAVDVYVNGVLLANTEIVSGTVTLTGTNTTYVMTARDIIDIIRVQPTLTDLELSFDPDQSDDGVTTIQWQWFVPYTTTTRTYDGTSYVYYYYWVQHQTNILRPYDDSCLSPEQVTAQLETIPTPYLIVQDPQDDQWIRGYDVPPFDKAGYDNGIYTAYDTQYQYDSTVYYRKAILSGVANIISVDDRFIAEFTFDETLRDDVRSVSIYDKKNKHEQWFMFRSKQISAVPQELWIKMTESLMGCKYDDTTVLVPATDRVYYDATNNTQTQYGLNDGQTFVNASLARATIVDYLQDPNNDFKPIDINAFFTQFNIDTDDFWNDATSVKAMCDFIYNSFDAVHTNSIWFNVLHDALSTKSAFDGILKTSWLALHGIRLLDVNGMLDD